MAGILFLILAVISCPRPFSFLAALAVHEGGHLLSAVLLGLGRPSLSLSATGIRLLYPRRGGLIPSLVLCLSGSFFGLLAAAIPFFSEDFRILSTGLSLINIIPLSCLDGGGALLLVLESFMLPDRAYKVSRVVSLTVAILLFCICAAVQLKAGPNITLLAVTVYITVSVLCEK